MSLFWKMHDDFIDWEWWNVYPHHPLFEWLLTKAKVSDCKVRGIIVRRGSLLTTWNEMQAALSNKHHQCSVGSLSRALNDLKDSGEISVRVERKNSIVTICNYEHYCGRGETIWSGSGVKVECSRSDTPIINKSKEYENNIYSASDGFNVDDGIVTEQDCRQWMRRYNEIARKFGVPEKNLAQQLTDTRKRVVSQCVRLRGRGTVDAMFARLAESEYYFREGRGGYINDFTKLWSSAVFDMVIEGSFVPQERKAATPEPKQEKPKSVGVIKDEAPMSRTTQEERKRTLLELIEYIKSNPRSLSCDVLEDAYRTGELQRLGINWKPNNV